MTPVQLLWVNLVQDTFAALALATDPPTLQLLNRNPDRKTSPIVTLNMWKMIIGQALFQLLVTFTLFFAGPRIFTSWGDSELRTTVFNTYVWLQIFNQFNCRRLDNKLNVFSGVQHNYHFIMITLITVGGQILIIYVGGAAFSTARLNGVQWATSIVLGLLSLPFAALIRLLPNTCIERSIPRFTLRTRPAIPDIERNMTP